MTSQVTSYAFQALPKPVRPLQFGNQHIPVDTDQMPAPTIAPVTDSITRKRSRWLLPGLSAACMLLLASLTGIQTHRVGQLQRELTRTSVALSETEGQLVITESELRKAWTDANLAIVDQRHARGEAGKVKESSQAEIDYLKRKSAMNSFEADFKIAAYSGYEEFDSQNLHEDVLNLVTETHEVFGYKDGNLGQPNPESFTCTVSPERFDSLLQKASGLNVDLFSKAFSFRVFAQNLRVSCALDDERFPPLLSAYLETLYGVFPLDAQHAGYRLALLEFVTQNPEKETTVFDTAQQALQETEEFMQSNGIPELTYNTVVVQQPPAGTG